MAMGRGSRADRGEPAGRLIKFEATDGVELYGLLFEPRRPARHVAIFLHGTGGASIFDSRRTNEMAGEFVRQGLAYFPFNNRGAHLIRQLRKRGKQKRSVKGGMAYERIRDCVADIDGALSALRSRGYRRFTLIGHSTGANKIAVYDHYRRRNPASRYVFLAGGDDVGLIYQQLGGLRFRLALRLARARRTSDELVPHWISESPMSWRSFYDMSNPDGDYNVFPFLEALRGRKLSKRRRFRHLRAVTKPSLVVYGQNDEYFIDDVSRHLDVLTEALGQKENFEFAVMEDANHGFGGQERELAGVILNWLARDDRR